MAMTAQVKSELTSIQVTKPCCRKAEVSSILRFAGGLHLVSGRIVVEAELDSGAAARRLRKDIAEIFGHPSDVVVISPSGIRKQSADQRWRHGPRVEVDSLRARCSRMKRRIDVVRPGLRGAHRDALPPQCAE